MNALHLTEANKECLRNLVRAITPDFEERLWDDIRARQRKREEAEKILREQAQASQASQTGWAGPPSPYLSSVTTGTANVIIPGPLIYTAGTTAATVVQPIYQSVGTGFTSYDATAQSAYGGMQGLTLKK